MKDIRQKIDDALGRYKVAAGQVRAEQNALIDVEDRVANSEEAQELLQEVAQAVQTEAHKRIAGVVSRCLEAIFDDPYEFRIEFDRKRGRTEARLLFVRRGLVLEDPLREVGGGVVDVAAFALRLSCLMLSRPSLRRLLVLDEPFSKIRGQENRERVRDLLVKLSEEMDIQFVLNIDLDAYPEFELGKVVQL